MTKTELFAGLSEIRVTPTPRTPARAKLQATCEQFADLLTEIALDPAAARCFVAAMKAPRGRDQEFLVRCFVVAQESLVAAGDLDAVTRF